MAKLDHMRGQRHQEGQRPADARRISRLPGVHLVSAVSDRRRPRGAMLVLPRREVSESARPHALIESARSHALTSMPHALTDISSRRANTSGALALLEAPAAVPEIRPIPARRHILIVEDDPRTAGFLRSAMELEGEPDWGIEVAGEGLHALELAARTPPDVVLLDVRLPGLDGGEVYRRLRAGCHSGHCRVLFMTAGTSLDLYQLGIEDGVLLRKPFDVGEMVGLVRALLPAD
ncbi:MAG TPA: response regulator [Ktedonobacterales bacterium]|jgi:CheY-like chemotaxis protein